MPRRGAMIAAALLGFLHRIVKTVGNIPGHVRTSGLQSVICFEKFRIGSTWHIECPTQVYTNVVEHGTESSSNDCEKNNSNVAPANDVLVHGVFIVITPIHVKAYDR
jgi:hypothetical protein